MLFLVLIGLGPLSSWTWDRLRVASSHLFCSRSGEGTKPVGLPLSSPCLMAWSPCLMAWRGALIRLRALFAGIGLVLNALSLLLFRRRHETGELFGDLVAAAIPFFHRLVFASFYGRRAYKQFWVAVYGGFAQSLFGGYVGIMGVFSLSSVWGCGRAGHATSLRCGSAGPGAILPIVPLSHVPSPIW